MIITITGTPGSGKTSVGKVLAERLKYDHVSMGDIRGEIAKRHGITIDELNAIGSREPWTDKEPDEDLRTMGKERDNLVIDTRTGFFFIPHSFKIFLSCDINIAAKRIFKDQREDEKKHDTVQGVKDMITQRMDDDRTRFKKWYDIDVNEMSHYDYVLDSTKLTVDETADIIMDKMRELGKIK